MLRDGIHALETGAEKGEGFPVFEAGKARGTGGEKGEKRGSEEEVKREMGRRVKGSAGGQGWRKVNGKLTES